MSRWRAAGIHFLISLTILACALALMRLLWYPDFYFAAIGAKGLLVLLFTVDVTLGPLITLIIFKAGKKGLKFDLSVIALCQLAALLYGMYTVFEARPVFTVYSGGRFDVVQAIQVELEGAEQSAFSTVPLTGPVWAALKVPEGQERTVVELIMSDKDPVQFPRFLVPYESAKSDVPAKLWSINRLQRKGKGPEIAERVRAFLSERNLDAEQVGYLPLKAPREDMAVIVSRASGDIVGVLRVNPW